MNYSRTVLFIFASLMHHICWAHYQPFIYAMGHINHISGYGQTPKGGMPGTTSEHRPSFCELGLYHDQDYQLGLGFTYHDFFAALDYQAIHAHKKSILKTDLITHNQFITAESDFHFYLNLKLYNFILGKQYAIDKNLSIAPALFLNLVDYHYTFSSTNQGGGRSFHMMGHELGGFLHYQIRPKLALDLSAITSWYFSNIELYKAELGLTYQLYHHRAFDITPRISCGFFKFAYEDSQVVPNHIVYRTSPSVGLGFIALLNKLG